MLRLSFLRVAGISDSSGQTFSAFFSSSNFDYMSIAAVGVIFLLAMSSLIPSGNPS